MEELFLWQEDPDLHFMDESKSTDDLEEGKNEELFEIEEIDYFNNNSEEIGIEHIMGIGGVLGASFEENNSSNINNFEESNSSNMNNTNNKISEFISIKDAFKSNDEVNQKAYPIRPFEKWVQDMISGKKSINDNLDEEP